MASKRRDLTDHRRNVTDADRHKHNYEMLMRAASKKRHDGGNLDNLISSKDRLDKGVKERFSMDEVVNEAFLLAENRRTVLATNNAADGLLNEARRILRGPDGGRQDLTDENGRPVRRVEPLPDGETVEDEMFSLDDHIAASIGSGAVDGGREVSFDTILDGVLSAATTGDKDRARSAIAAGMRLFARLASAPVMPKDPKASAVYSYILSQSFGRFSGTNRELSRELGLTLPDCAYASRRLQKAGHLRVVDGAFVAIEWGALPVPPTSVSQQMTAALLRLAQERGFIRGNLTAFAEELELSCPKDRAADIREALEELESQGLVYWAQTGTLKGFGTPGSLPRLEDVRDEYIDKVLAAAEGGSFRGTQTDLAAATGLSRGKVLTVLTDLDQLGAISQHWKGTSRGFTINKEVS